MGKLASFQEKFRQAIHEGVFPEGLDGKIVDDRLPAISRLQVYQNNYKMTLVSLLEGVFPLTKAFVGEDFFQTAAKLFLQDNPPQGPQLDRFGEEFSAFLSSYPHVADVVYVADVAGLEWAVHDLQHAQALEEGAKPVPSVYEGVYLNPNVRVIESQYPLLQLWMVGMGQLMPEAVHIGAGGQTVAVTLDQYEVKLNVLGAQESQAFEALNGRGENADDNVDDAIKSLTVKNIILNN